MKLDIPVRKCMKLGILFVNLQFNQGGRKRKKKKKTSKSYYSSDNANLLWRGRIN